MGVAPLEGPGGLAGARRPAVSDSEVRLVRGGLTDEDHCFWSESHAERGSRSTCGDHGQPEHTADRRFGALSPIWAGTAHRWLKATFAKLSLVKATFSHYRTASEATTVTPTTSAASAEPP